MPKLSQLEQLDVALKDAAKLAGPKVSSAKVAEDFFRSHGELIEPFIDQWVLEKLAALIRYDRIKGRRQKDRQLVFQRNLGFAHIPRKIEVRPGETIPTGEATSKVFRKLKAQMRREKIRSLEPALEELDRANALFARYTKNKKTEHITWAELIEKEAEKAIQQGLFDAPDIE